MTFGEMGNGQSGGSFKCYSVDCNRKLYYQTLEAWTKCSCLAEIFYVDNDVSSRLGLLGKMAFYKIKFPTGLS